MRYCKPFGAALLLACGCAIGVLCTRLARHRLRQGESFLVLLRAIRLQIERFSTPLSDILRQLDPALLAACGMTGSSRELTALLRSTPLYLSEEAALAIMNFARIASSGSKGEAIRACDDAIGTLHLYCDAQRRALPGQERAAFWLPLILSAMLTLLLL